MSQSHSSSTHPKDDLQEIKKEFDNLSKRVNDLKDKGGNAMMEQLHDLSNTIAKLKNKGEKKKDEVVKELSSSTREHPLRNLACAFGLGAILSLIIR